MKRLLILLLIVFCGMPANADVVGLKLYPNNPRLADLALPRAVVTPLKNNAGGDLPKGLNLSAGLNNVGKHDRQVGMTIHTSSIPETYWGEDSRQDFSRLLPRLASFLAL